MVVSLGQRDTKTVETFWRKARTPQIMGTLPLEDQTLEEALADFRRTLLPGAASYGRTVLLDGSYIGDVWCYGIDMIEEPNAMVSFCILDPANWSRGIASQALALFLEDVTARYPFRTVGAFAYADNGPSLRVLEKDGFQVMEEFTEDGRASKYLQKRMR